MIPYVLVALLVVILLTAFVRRYTFWSKRGVRQYNFWKIWLMNVLEVVKQPPLTDAITKLYTDFPNDRYVGTYQLFAPRLCVKDPDLIKRIFVKDFDHFVDHTMFIPTDGDPIWEKSLFSLTGNEWRHMRAIASPSFTSSKMKIMFGIMLKTTHRFLDYLDNQKGDNITMEMKDVFARLTNDIFFSTHFGIICDSLENPDNIFYAMGKRGADFGGFWIKLRFVLIQMCPRLTRILGIKVFDQRVSAFFKMLVKENIRARKEQKIILPDLIQLLMETKKNENPQNEDFDSGFLRNQNLKLTQDQITSLAIAFFGGGFDSTSTLLAFVAYELALHVDVQQTLQKEIDDTIEDCKGELTYEALMRMKYLDTIISETLRKWPGGFFLDRRCVKPYTIDVEKPGEVPVHLKKGDGISLPLFALQRDSQLYPEPDRFVPERFDESKVNPYAYMPFGIGPRHCIGNRFALLEVKVVIFHVLSKFSFDVIEETAIPIRLARRNFQLTSKDGFWLGLRRRT